MKLIAALLLLLAAPGGREPEIVVLWPGAPAGDVGIPREEHFRELKVNGKDYEVGGKPTKWKTLLRYWIKGGLKLNVGSPWPAPRSGAHRGTRVPLESTLWNSTTRGM